MNNPELSSEMEQYENWKAPSPGPESLVVAPGPQINDSPKPALPEVRRYTKEQAPEARTGLAQHIRGERQAYFKEKADFDTQIASLVQEINEHRSGLEWVKTELEQLSNQLETNKANRLTELLNFFKNRELTKQIVDKRQRITGYIRLLEDREVLKDALEKLIKDNSALVSVRQRIPEFYREQTEELRQYEEERAFRDVAEISRRHNVVLIHAMHPEGIAVHHNLVWDTDRRASLEQKLDAVLALQPSLSCSSIGAGENVGQMWGAMGVILKGGTVELASAGDLVSEAVGVKNRTTDHAPDREREAITEAINGKGRGYNELAVSDPQIAGFFINVEEDGSVTGAHSFVASVMEHAALAKVLEKYQMPIYGLKEGEPHRLSFDEQQQIFVLDKPLSREQVLDSPYQLTSERRQEYVDKLMTEAIFRYRSLEAQGVDYATRGRLVYLELGHTRLSQANSEVYEVPILGGRVVVRQTAEGLVEEITYTNPTKAPREWTVKTGELPHNSLRVGDLSDESPGTVEEYLELAERSLIKINQELIEARTVAEVERLVSWKTIETYHLYGFAQQAGLSGDFLTQEQAEEVAGRYLKKQTYVDAMEKRANGQTLRILMEDIE